MIALITLVIQVFMVLVIPSDKHVSVMVIPPKPNYMPSAIERPIIHREYPKAAIVEQAPVITEDVCEWSEYHSDAVAEYADEFTALFNSYEVKRAKNGALMIRSGNQGSFKFAKKGI